MNQGENQGFYRAFEERYRGPRELIQGRLKAYLPFIMPLRELYQPATAIDLGCGRGEWLELLQDNGFQPHGVDLDGGMLAACTERGLAVTQGDAIAYLESLSDESQCVVSGFHIAEHIAFDDLQILVSQSLRVLKPGGLLILETPNPENVVVGTSSFYLDPTHIRPIPPELLSFLPEHHGYGRVRVLRLQEDKSLHERNELALIEVLGGVSPDYAVVAQKRAAPDVLDKFDAAFAGAYGVELHQLAGRYDQKIDRIANEFGQRLSAAEAQAGGMADALARITVLQDRLIAASTHQTQAEAQVVVAESCAQEAEDRAARAELRAQEAQSRVEQLQAKMEQLEEDLSATRQELHEVHQANHYHWQSWESSKQELETVHQANHHHWQLAETRGQSLNALHRSLSWRITAPLRFVAGLVIHPGVTLRNSVNRAVHCTVETCQRPLSRLMAAVLRRPKLAYRINQLLMRYPGLYRQLLGVARRQGVVPGAPNYVAPAAASQQPAEPALVHLPPRARQIYADLKAAIENNKRPQ